MPETQPYLMLKLAHELYRKAPENLAPAERQRVDTVVARQLKIERRILATPDAAQVVLPVSSVDQSLGEIRRRYGSEAEFAADLEKSGLSPTALRVAIERDLTVEAVLERVASQAAAVTDTEVEIFYLTHHERFLRPASRTLRHILVTVNDSLAGSERETARARIDEIRERLQKLPERFAEQALKHSECPTAMNGGLLGTVARGQLFPEIEPAAFALRTGELSAVVESPMGFHVIFCEGIEAPNELPLDSVRDKVRQALEDTRRRTTQKAWIASLFGR